MPLQLSASAKAAIELASESFAIAKHTHDAHQIYKMIVHFYGIEKNEIDHCKEKSLAFLQEGEACNNALRTLVRELKAFLWYLQSASNDKPDIETTEIFSRFSQNFNQRLMMIINYLLNISLHNRKIIYITSHLESDDCIIEKYNTALDEMNVLWEQFNANIYLIVTAIITIKWTSNDTSLEQRLTAMKDERKNAATGQTVQEQCLSSIECLEETIKAAMMACCRPGLAAVTNLIREGLTTSSIPTSLAPIPLVTKKNMATLGGPVLHAVLAKEPTERYRLASLLLRPKEFESVSLVKSLSFPVYYHSVGYLRRNWQPIQLELLLTNQKKLYLHYLGLKRILEKQVELVDHLLADLKVEWPNVTRRDQVESGFQFQRYQITESGDIAPQPMSAFARELNEQTLALTVVEEHSDVLTPWQNLLSDINHSQLAVVRATSQRAKAIITASQPTLLVSLSNHSAPRSNKKEVFTSLRTYKKNLEVQVISYSTSITAMEKKGDQLASYKEHSNRIDYASLVEDAKLFSSQICKDDFLELVWLGADANTTFNGQPVYYDETMLMTDHVTLSYFLGHGADPTVESASHNRFLKGGSLLDFFAKNDSHQDLLHLVLENVPHFIQTLNEDEKSFTFIYERHEKIDVIVKDIQDLILRYTKSLLTCVQQGYWYEYGRKTMPKDIELLRNYLVGFKELIQPKGLPVLIETLNNFFKATQNGREYQADGMTGYSYHSYLAWAVADLQEDIERDRPTFAAYFDQESSVTIPAATPSSGSTSSTSTTTTTSGVTQFGQFRQPAAPSTSKMTEKENGNEKQKAIASAPLPRRASR